MRWWKVMGLAGLAGVAATGVAVARAERRRRAYTPDEIRSRLHLRIEEAVAAEAASPPGRDVPLHALVTERVAPPRRSVTERLASVRSGGGTRARGAYRRVTDRLRAARTPGRHRNS